MNPSLQRASVPPSSSENHHTADQAMNNGFNQLHGILNAHMAAFYQNHPNGANSSANLLGSALAGSPTTTQPPQFPHPAPIPQLVSAHGAPNLLALLGHPSALGGPLLGAFTGTGAGVGSCDNDDELLVQALHESHSRDWTYRRALDSLHGVNNHTAAQWKDYYLDHTPRINKLVALRNGEKTAVAKKPMLDSKPRHDGAAPLERRPSSSKQPGSPHESASQRHSTSTHQVVVKKEKTDKTRKASDKGKGKAVPSRTPSPPRNPQWGRNGYSFTEEDRQFLIDYATYRLREDPHLKKADIVIELAQKAPHHTVSSWTGHWSQQREFYDQFIPPFFDGRRHRTPSESASESEEEEDDGSSYQSGEETDEDEDVQNMSGPKEYVNDADRRVIARYIASVGSEWSNLRSRERWEPVERMYPQRSQGAWAEMYRNHAKAIDKLVAKYRRRNHARKSAVRAQKAVPSWAKNKKRARSDDEEHVSKRSRDDGDSSS